MRRYNSFFVQTWVDDASGAQGMYRLKVEHIQTGAVTVLMEPSELPEWLCRQIVDAPAVERQTVDDMGTRA